MLYRRDPNSASIMLSIAELALINLPFGLDRHIQLLGIPKRREQKKKEKRNQKEGHKGMIIDFIDILKTNLNGVALRPNLSRGWWILAKCLIEMGRYEWVNLLFLHLYFSFIHQSAFMY